MRDRKTHIALTVNEFGDVTGLVTLEDLLEVIVGDIRDEYDKEKDPIREVDLHTYKIRTHPFGSKTLTEEFLLIYQEENTTPWAAFYYMNELKGDLTENAMINYGNCQITLGRYKESAN